MEKWLEEIVKSFENKASEYRRRGRPKPGDYRHNAMQAAYNSEAAIYETCAKEIRAGAKQAVEIALEKLPKDVANAIRESEE